MCTEPGQLLQNSGTFTFGFVSYIVPSMRRVFIADAHLEKPDDINYRTLLRFLDGLKGNTNTLFIMGDLFEFWIGYKNIPFTHYLPVLTMLRQLAESGTRIIYFEGNHDFHMGPFFEEILKAKIHCNPTIFTIDDKNVYLCHGDQVISSDYGHRFLRFLLHGSLTRRLLPLVPYRITSIIAQLMSHRSRKNHAGRSRKWDYLEIMKNFADSRFRSGCDVVIAGHFHYPYIDRAKFDDREKVLLCLGDWKTHFSYGEWSEGRLELKTYRE